MKQIICDCGSTKAEWWVDGDKFTTVGMNPSSMDSSTLLSTIPQLPQTGEIWFYGAGCTPQASPLMQEALAQSSGIHPEDIHVHSDMLGAARATCRHCEGIVAILGTGSNSCLYDGRDIVASTPALGYILGDEGSGAVLGRNLVGALYKGVLPKELLMEFEHETGLTQAHIINKVYRQPAPNRFLASLVPFIARHRTQLHNMLLEAFALFVQRNLTAYGRNDLPIHFVGGVAQQFQTELQQALEAQNMQMGAVKRSIIDDLALFHTTKP